MPWWGWIILAFIMIAVFACGVVYAVVHAMRAARSASGTMHGVQHYLSAMQNTDDHQASKISRPSFTEPLRESSHRYSKAHEGVVMRDARKRSRHEGKWALWRDNPVPGSVTAESGVNAHSDTNQTVNTNIDVHGDVHPTSNTADIS